MRRCVSSEVPARGWGGIRMELTETTRTFCMRSSLLDDMTTGPSHNTAQLASQRRVSPVPGWLRVDVRYWPERGRPQTRPAS